MSVQTVIHNNGSKTYKVRWREGGSHRARHFGRLQDARTWDAEVRRRRQSGDLVLLTAGSQTLGEYAATWWEDYAEQHLAPRTLEVYASQLDLRITPMLGGYRLREITPGLVQEFLGRLGRDGVGDASIVKTATVPPVDLQPRRHRGARRAQPGRGRPQATPEAKARARPREPRDG